SGIGQGCALMAGRHGAKVVACDFNAKAAEATQRQAEAEGLDVRTFVADLTNPAEVEKLIEFAIATYGRLDVLVNSAAVANFALIEDMEFEKDWRYTLTGELDTVFLVCKAAWPHLKQSGAASIVNLASANAHGPLRHSAALAHCAGK